MLGTKRRSWVKLGALLALALSASGARAAPCGGNFDAWLQGVEQEAAAAGVSQRTIAASLSGMTPDPRVLGMDRNQKVFHQSFEQFSATRVTPYAVQKGQAMMRRYAPVISRIERQFGVPGAVVVAIWGLETSFGANNGNFSTIRALVTLAYDCRRTDRFRGELIDALKIVDRGDLAPTEMRGAWAGEIGQTQLLPSSYLRFAIDYDGNGRRDLIHSAPDVLASTANYLHGYGWHPGQPWDQGSANFQVLQEWNKSEVYSKTVAYYADRLAAVR